MMKKHFLQIDLDPNIRLTSRELKHIEQWLEWASPAFHALFKKKIIPHSRIKSVRVSVLLCGEAKIRKLNRDYRQKDYVTDVLSFPSYEDLRDKKADFELMDGELFLGDLAICHQKASKQAREFKITYLDEFIHLFFHGLIHLLGYDHELSKKEEKLMEKWEKEALDLFSKIRKRGLAAPG